jgi:hypothetical protein
MRVGTWLLVALLAAAAQPCLAAPSDPIRIELNALATVKGHCQASFVIENKTANAIGSLKLDLVIFNKEGVIDQRLVVEMGPLRGVKTVVKAFAFDGDCERAGSILLNDVTACDLPDSKTCLDRLHLSSKLNKVRFFK